MINGSKIIENTLTAIGSDFDGLYLALKGRVKLPAGIASAMWLEANRLFSELAKKEGFAWGFHGFSREGFEFGSKAFESNIWQYVAEAMPEADARRLFHLQSPDILRNGGVKVGRMTDRDEPRETAGLTGNVRAWRATGTFEDVLGRRLFVHRRSGTVPLVVLLHGFPSSSFDWRGVLAAQPSLDVLAFDFLGFGLSDKPRDHVYTLAWQADAVTELIRRRGNPPTVLVAHDMGTSVVTELLARDLDGGCGFPIHSVLLFNGSIVLERATLTSGQKLLRGPLGPVAGRLMNEPFFRRQFASLFSSAHPLTRAEAADQWALIAHGGGRRIAHRLIHYLEERERFAERWHGAIRDWPGRLSLAWGLQDPVATTAVLDALRELRPEATVTELPDLGHYPQIEDPGAIAALIAACTT